MTITHTANGLVQTIRSGQRAFFFQRYWHAFQAWRKRAKIRAELSSFSDRELWDIGISRGEIDYIASNGPVDPRGR